MTSVSAGVRFMISTGIMVKVRVVTSVRAGVRAASRVHEPKTRNNGGL